MATSTTGAIPDTEEIVLESSKEQWQLFERGMLGPTFSTKGIITIDKAKNTKGKLSLTFIEIGSPGNYVCNTRVIPRGRSENISEGEIDGMIKASRYLTNIIDEKTWFFAGYIAGKQNIPVIVLYYERINIAVYSIIKNEEEIHRYFSKGIPDNIHMN